MPVSGRYIARRFRRGAATYLAAYARSVQDEILPSFADLETRANKAAESEYERLIAQPASDDFDGDLSSLAEAAEEAGHVYYDTMDRLRRASLTLYSVGLFHLLEQELAACCRDASFGVNPPSDTKLEVVAGWYKKYFRVDLKALRTWASIDELRLLANTAKHGDGPSARQLRAIRPDLFEDPRIRERLSDFPFMYTSSHVQQPLAGEDLFISDDTFAAYGDSAYEFIIEIAQHFESNADELFFQGT